MFIIRFVISSRPKSAPFCRRKINAMNVRLKLCHRNASTSIIFHWFLIYDPTVPTNCDQPILLPDSRSVIVYTWQKAVWFALLRNVFSQSDMKSRFPSNPCTTKVYETPRLNWRACGARWIYVIGSFIRQTKVVYTIKYLPMDTRPFSFVQVLTGSSTCLV